MKIFQLTYSLKSGGAERFVVDMANELSLDHNNQVYLVAINDDRIPENSHYLTSLLPNVSYLCLGEKSGLSIQSFLDVLKIIIKIRPDVVHTSTDALLLFIPSLIFPSIKYIQTLHTVAEHNIACKFLKFIYRFFYKHNLIIPVNISDQCQISFRKYYDIDNAKCIINGRAQISVTNKFGIVSDNLRALKKCENSLIFIHVARYSPEKNQKMLFEAFSLFTKEYCDAQLIILGTGYSETLRNDVYKLCHNIHFYGSQINVGDYLANSDYYLLSSLYEGLPLSLLEAMSMGVVPICTPAGGVINVIENGVTGFLSKSFSSNDFYMTIKQAVNSDTSAIRKNIVQCYQEKYSIQKCVAEYYELYIEHI